LKRAKSGAATRKSSENEWPPLPDIAPASLLRRMAGSLQFDNPKHSESRAASTPYRFNGKGTRPPPALLSRNGFRSFSREKNRSSFCQKYDRKSVRVLRNDGSHKNVKLFATHGFPNTLPAKYSSSQEKTHRMKHPV